MFCVYCGKKIPDGAKVCPYCKKRQLGEDYYEEDDDISSVSSKIEYFAALSPIFPAISYVLEWIIALMAAFVFGVIMRLLHIFGYSSIIFMPLFIIGAVLSLIGVVATCYVVLSDEDKQNKWGIITIIFSFVAFALNLWKLIYNVYHISVPLLSIISIILGFDCLIFGLDVISRVFIQKLGIESIPDIKEDFIQIKDFLLSLKENFSSNTKDNEYSDRRNGGRSSSYNEFDIFNEKESYFDGTGVELLGLLLLLLLVTLLTCSIGSPWILCKIIRWKKQHTVIDGRRLDFDGTGSSLLGHQALWFVLILVTCSIYTPFVYTSFLRWSLKHTFYEDSPDERGNFDGSGFEFFGYSTLLTAISAATLQLAGAWAVSVMEKWEMSHVILDKDRLIYKGSAVDLFGKFFVSVILTLITCFIYLPWGIVSICKYICKNTHVGGKVL